MEIRPVPLSFRLARAMVRNHVRGGHRLMSVIERLGRLDRMVSYPLANGVSVHVPIHRPENRWDASDVNRYEERLIDLLDPLITPQTVLLDCGAEIGMISVLLHARCGSRLERAIAIEPNPRCWDALDVNMTALSGTVIRAAVGSTPGRGGLKTSSQDDLDYALYVERCDAGETTIVTIDQVAARVPADRLVMLKLDVEGWEGEALKGARETLTSHRFIVTMEANGPVYERTGVDPCEWLPLIPGIEQCSIRVAEEPEKPVDLTRPFMAQFPETLTSTRNIVVWRT
jgi:FkbM family methyltransferase